MCLRLLILFKQGNNSIFDTIISQTKHLSFMAFILFHSFARKFLMLKTVKGESYIQFVQVLALFTYLKRWYIPPANVLSIPFISKVKRRAVRWLMSMFDFTEIMLICRSLVFERILTMSCSSADSSGKRLRSMPCCLARMRVASSCHPMSLTKSSAQVMSPAPLFLIKLLQPSLYASPILPGKAKTSLP